MKRAIPASGFDVDAILARIDEWDPLPGEPESFPFENKPDDWGRVKGSLVAVDYSEPKLASEDEKRVIVRDAGWLV